MSQLPTGTVTFLFTDIEGSTRRWEHDPAATRTVVERHLDLLREAVERHRGVLFKVVGDAVHAAFPTAPAAVAAAVAAQRALLAEDWGALGPLRVRMALHAGEAEADPRGDYLAAPLNRLARLLAAGHGGQVLLSHAVQQLARGGLPQDVSLRELGEHRLRDLLEPERVFQLLHPDLPAEFPALKTLAVRPNNLPRQPTPFLGREREAGEVVALLRRDNVHVCTLTGPGGTGKTRLALQSAADLLEDFADGVFFVPLAPVNAPGLVAAAIGEALGIREAGAQSSQDRLRDALATRELLLVLDNVEHLLAAAPLVGGLVAGSPRLKVLATSRAPLRLRAEREYPVPPLPLPPEEVAFSLEETARLDAVQLFVDRARAVRPDFALDAENIVAVAAIVRRLDGLPLAIELAAARVRTLPPRAMLARLEKRLPLLAAGARDAPARQRTLRDAIAWSYDLIGPDDRTLFRRLAVFVGGCTLEAAETVADPGAELDTFGGLERLVEHSLLRQADEPGGEPRFSMLETVREFGLERLADGGEEGDVRARHAAYFAAWTERADDGFRSAEGTAWVERCRVELPNIRGALAWAVSANGDPILGLRIAAALRWFWTVRGVGEGRGWLQRLLERGEEAPTAVRAKAMLVLGYLASLASDFPRADRLLHESLDHFSELRDELGVTHATFALGLLAERQGDADSAEALLTEALHAFAQRGMTAWEATTRFWLANVAFRRDDLPRARRLLEEALRLHEQTGWASGKAMVLTNLGHVVSLDGDIDRAEAIEREALALGWESGDLYRVAQQLVGLAWYAAGRGDGVRAARLGGAGHAVAGKIGYELRFALVDKVAARDYYDQLVAKLQELLGADAFVAAWAAGRALTPEEAVTEALAVADEALAPGEAPHA